MIFRSLMLVFVLFYGTVIWGLMAGVGCLFGCSLIFQPPKPSYHSLEGGFHLQTKDGKQIYVVHRVNPRARFTVLFSYGNAEDLGYLDSYLQEYESYGFSILAWDYRGYGQSSGSPSESAVFSDLKVLYQYLTSVRGVNPRTIIAHGRSLGGGAAVELARRYELGGIILESTFVSAFRVVTRWPILPCDRFRNLEKMLGIREPVLVIHGKKDDIVGFWHGQMLHTSARGIRRRLWVENARHNDVVKVAGEAYWQAITDFTDELHALSDMKNP